MMGAMETFEGLRRAGITVPGHARRGSVHLWHTSPADKRIRSLTQSTDEGLIIAAIGSSF